MKTPEKENQQVDVLIKTVLIFMIIIFGAFIATKCGAQTTKQNIGYYIWIRDAQGTIKQHFTDVNKAQYLVSSKTESIYLNIVLDCSVYFEQRTQYRWIYCEKMNYKVKKNGKIKFKRIKI
ncbi:MAG TPA: hypothetical protein VN192_02815 [Flavobacterium sp.]|nr:hypothetical protein [Flavobacterium sp.]